MTGNTRKPSNVSGPPSKGKKGFLAFANPKTPSSSSAVQAKNVTKKDKQVMGFPTVLPTCGKTSGIEKFMSESSVADKKEESMQQIDEIKSTEVSGHLEEKGNNECQITNEKLKKLTEAMEYISDFLEKVPKSEIKNKDVADQIKGLHCDLTRYLKEEQGKEKSGTSEGSSDQGNKIDEGQSYSTIYGGTDKVLGTLDDLVKMYKGMLCVPVNDPRCPLKKIVEKMPQFIDTEGRPSHLLVKLMWEILFHVFHLHDHGKIHGYLNPKSILICEEGSIKKRQKELYLCAKLSPDSPGTDISEWQAPEQRNDPSVRTSSADIYSLGAIFYYCFTGERLSERWGTVGNSKLVSFHEADYLLSRSLMEKPNSRPQAIKLLCDPLFWSHEKRLTFLRNTSERAGPQLCFKILRHELDKISVRTIIGREGKEWYEKIEDEDVRKYIMEKKKECGYNLSKVRDLVRLIRNMIVHYGELPPGVQISVGTLNKGFDNYFASLFPNLLIEVYKAVHKPSSAEYKIFGRFFKFKRLWLSFVCRR